MALHQGQKRAFLLLKALAPLLALLPVLLPAPLLTPLPVLLPAQKQQARLQEQPQPVPTRLTKELPSVPRLQVPQMAPPLPLPA